MGIEGIVSEFRSWAGSNYRIEARKPGEIMKYNEWLKMDTDKGRDNIITLAEYLSFLQKTSPGLIITQIDIEAAKQIDILQNADLFSEDAKINAVIKLGELRDKIALPVLLEAARDDKSWNVRLEAVRALGSLEDIGSIPVLVHIRMEDQHTKVRGAAREALYRIYSTLKENNPLREQIESTFSEEEKALGVKLEESH